MTALNSYSEMFKFMQSIYLIHCSDKLFVASTSPNPCSNASTSPNPCSNARTSPNPCSKALWL